MNLKSRVLITRAEHQTDEFKKKVEHAGLEAIVLPMIEIKAIEANTDLTNVFNQMEKYDWLIFTSSNSVKFFFDAVDEQNVKMYFFPNLKIATVGEKTKMTLEQRGYRTNFVPIKFTAKVLTESLEDLKGKNILIPRSGIATNDYIRAFEEKGAKVHAIDLYNNNPRSFEANTLNKLFDQNLDYITFTSGSTAKSFADNVNKLDIKLDQVKVICIGPSTAKVASDNGLKVEAIAETHTIEGIIDVIKKLENNV